MSESVGCSIGVVCEGPSDLNLLHPLVDQVILRVPWIEDEVLDSFRKYRGFRSDEPFLAWSHIRQLKREHRVVFLGNLTGLPSHRDALRTREAIALLTLHSPQPVDAILIFRDGDKEFSERKKAIQQARKLHGSRIPVIVGIANCMREAWLLCGFEPIGQEQELLDQECTRIGFDPRTRTHLLQASDGTADQSPKRILSVLTAGSQSRECCCISECSLDLLRSRGDQNGLREFIEEVELRLLPVFSR